MELKGRPVNAVLVDERDARREYDAAGYRVFIVRPDGAHDVFDIAANGTTPGEVEAWAKSESAGSDYRLAVRVLSGDEVVLVWVAPSPNSLA